MNKLLLLALLLAPLTVRAQEKPHHVRFATVFTFLDAVFITRKVWTQEDVEVTMRTAKELGVERIYWRVDAGGTFVYPTKVGQAYQWDGRGEESAALVESIRSLGDPLAVFAEAARRHGIEFYAWYTVRDRNATSESYNPHHPAEAEIFKKVGRYAAISPFYAQHPQYNMERREGEGAGVAIPETVAIVLKTTVENQSVTPEDLAIWQSDDNLMWHPVSESWEVTQKADADGVIRHEVTGISVTKPWVKLTSRRGDWTFGGGSVGDWILFRDQEGREWSPYAWMAAASDQPEYGEARYPYKSAHRAEGIRNGVPWDTVSNFRFGPVGGGLAFYTPAMQPERYLLGYPCFAYQAVQDYEAKVIDELLERPIDGVALCVRTHVRSSEGEAYGFNPPVAEAYQQRYGVDPRKEDFDAEKMAQLHGEFYTGFLRKASQQVRAKGKKVVAMYEPEPELGLEWQPGQMSPWWDVGKVRWPWKQWVKEELVDQLMVFTTGFNLPWDDKLEGYLREVRREAGAIPVSLFYDPDLRPHLQNVGAYTRMVQSAFSSPLIDEVNVFEFVEFDIPERILHEPTRALKR